MLILCLSRFHRTSVLYLLLCANSSFSRVFRSRRIAHLSGHRPCKRILQPLAEHAKYAKEKGGILMLSSKELMQLEDYLTIEQSCIKTLNHFASQLQDTQAKQLLQQMAQKNQQNFQSVSKHLNAGQNLQ